MTDQDLAPESDAAGHPGEPVQYRYGYYDGLAERSRRLRLVENDVVSLRTAVLMLCAAVAVLAYLVMREDRHAV